MANQIVNPSGLSEPLGYAHAVRAGGTVFLGGQTAMDGSGRIVPGGIVEQFRRALHNVLVSLKASGGKPDDLVSVNIYLVDVEDYQRHGREVGAVWRELVGAHYPAMAGVGVTRLWQPEALVEIQAVAVITENL